MKPDKLSPLMTGLEKYYDNSHRQMWRADDAFNRQFNKLVVNLPAGIRIHESSTATVVVDGMSDQVSTVSPTVLFGEKGSSKKALAHKELMEYWGTSVLAETQKRAISNPFEQAKKDLFLRGAGCVKVLVDINSLPDVKVKSRKTAKEYIDELLFNWPWIVRAIDPLSVFPAPGDRRPLPYIIERKKRTQFDMWQMYPDWASQVKFKSKLNLTTDQLEDPGRPVEWLEYWSNPVFVDGKQTEPGYYIVEADEVRVIDKENPYGVLPYSFS